MSLLHIYIWINTLYTATVWDKEIETDWGYIDKEMNERNSDGEREIKTEIFAFT